MPYRGKRFRRSHGVMSEINVTPLVDVMLVLLIIFMITAPLARFGFDVRLPKVEASPVTREESWVITLHRNKKVFLNENQIAVADLGKRLEQIVRSNGNNVDMFLRADEELPYGFVMQVMASIRHAGVRNLGMVTEPVPITQ